MTTKVGSEALKPNPALKALEGLVGRWETLGTHPYLPAKTLHGRATFEWIEEGAFLMMRSEIDEPEIPSGVAIFGSDDATGDFFMLYFDERKLQVRLIDKNLCVVHATWKFQEDVVSKE